jgi:crotonobetainyl-CoA:carnitine CoA-transferase CaiB-like acyl-CoA transferase
LQAIDRYEERDRYAATMASILRDYSYVELSARFEAHAIWHERVQDYEALRTDPQAIHNGTFEEIDVRGERATLIAHPLRYDDNAPALRTMPLVAGADSRDILTEMGVSRERQDVLIGAGVVGIPVPGELAHAGQFSGQK